MLPLVIAQTIASISCGLGVTATGYIWPFMTAASVFTAIGAGLLTTFHVDISVGRWVGYQIVYGVGMGLAAQTPLMVAQNVVALEDIAIASSLIMMMQAIGGYVLLLLSASRSFHLVVHTNLAANMIFSHIQVRLHLSGPSCLYKRPRQ